MMKKRLTSFLLAACMMLPLSASAWAAEHPQMEGEEDVTLQPSYGVRSKQSGSNGTLIVRWIRDTAAKTAARPRNGMARPRWKKIST